MFCEYRDRFSLKEFGSRPQYHLNNSQNCDLQLCSARSIQELNSRENVHDNFVEYCNILYKCFLENIYERTTLEYKE